MCTASDLLVVNSRDMYPPSQPITYLKTINRAKTNTLPPLLVTL